MAIRILDLGIVNYEDAVKKQEDILEKRISGLIEDTVLIMEHPPVVTLGISAARKDIKNESFFAERGIGIVGTKRGGGITYHAPGQLIVYPVVELCAPMKDISAFIDRLEEVTACSLQDLGIPAGRVEKRRGVWVSGKKIAFTGIKLRKWVTFHGIAVNINNDISGFEMIDPCGDANIKVTSASIVNGGDLDMLKVKEVFSRRFSRLLEKG